MIYAGCLSFFLSLVGVGGRAFSNFLASTVVQAQQLVHSHDVSQPPQTARGILSLTKSWLTPLAKQGVVIPLAHSNIKKTM